MEKIIEDEYRNGFNKNDEKWKEYIKDMNKKKIIEALKIAGFSDDGDSLYKYGYFKDTIDPNKKGFITFRIKNGHYYSVEGCELGYQIEYFHRVWDEIVISIHGYPSVTYEFKGIWVPDEIMFATSGVEEKFINFLDEKLNTIRKNIDFSNYQNIREILK